MTQLPTLGLLSITDGRLMGGIGDVYRVISFLIGRDAFTHELPMYGRKAEPLLQAMYPGLAGQQELPWERVRDAALSMFGTMIDVPDMLEGVLADGNGPISNLTMAMEARND